MRRQLSEHSRTKHAPFWVGRRDRIRQYGLTFPLYIIQPSPLRHIGRNRTTIDAPAADTANPSITPSRSVSNGHHLSATSAIFVALQTLLKLRHGGPVCTMVTIFAPRMHHSSTKVSSSRGRSHSSRLSPGARSHSAPTRWRRSGRFTLQFQHGVELVGQVGQHRANVVEHVALAGGGGRFSRPAVGRCYYGRPRARRPAAKAELQTHHNTDRR